MRLVFLVLFSSCSNLFYQPHKKIYVTPDKYGIKYRQIQFKHNNEHVLYGWVLEPKASTPKGSILFFHGNAENRSTHFFNLAWITKRGYQVIIPDYSGYGDSDGAAFREQLYQDSILITKQFVESFSAPRIIFGQSLGGNISVAPAVKFQNQIDLLVLDSTFLSYEEIGYKVLKRNWITYILSPLAFLLLNDDFSANNYFGNYKGKLLVLHGMADQIVPLELGKDIYQKYPHQKDKVWFSQSLHIRAFTQEKNRNIFFDKLESIIK